MYSVLTYSSLYMIANSTASDSPAIATPAMNDSISKISIVSSY